MFRSILTTGLLFCSMLFGQPDYASYLGGSRMDSIESIAVDSSGYIYVAGWTESTDLRVKSAAQSRHGGGVDAFVARFAADGRTLVYLTYLGGSDEDRALGIAVDSAGNAYVTGYTKSLNFPTAGSLRTVRSFGRHAFLAKIGPDGALAYSFSFGGSGPTSGNAVAVDSSGNAYVAGGTASSDFPLINAAQKSFGGIEDGFVVKVASSGAAFLYSTYTGGRYSDAAKAVAVDAGGTVYVTGYTDSPDFPVPNGVRRTVAGQDAFVLKISPDGGKFVYGSFLGGSRGTVETGTGIAVGPGGSVYVCGYTNSTDFPVVSTVRTTFGGNIDGFVIRLSPAGDSIDFSTYLGGYGFDAATAVAVDSSGRARVAGYTTSGDFPASAESPNTLGAGRYGAFVVQADADTRTLAASSLIADPGGNVTAHAVALRGSSVYLAGLTTSLTFPTVNAWQSMSNGSTDGIIAIFGPTGSSGLRFVPIAPCRLADTRLAPGPFGAPIMAADTTRTFVVPSGNCSIPPTAAAYSFNIAVVPQSTLGNLTVWPAGQSRPGVTTLTSTDGKIRSVAAVSAAGVNGGFSVHVSDSTDVVIDINGYFVPDSDPAGLVFYPTPPCRIMDTRLAAGPLGGPLLSSGTVRTVPMLASSCRFPATARAYSLNMAAVPLRNGYLTAWPTGKAQPLTATLNFTSELVTANAALLPAGSSGDISLYASGDMHLVIDANGYFAPPGPGGLSFYKTTPCRAVDTRPTPFAGDRQFAVSGKTCGLPEAAAYVGTATVLPVQTLGYLTLWNWISSKPLVATLNADDGAVTSNLALVPASNGAIGAYVTHLTHFIFDVSGYFAP